MTKLLSFIIRYLLSIAANSWVSLLGLLPGYREACYEAGYRLGWRKRPVHDDGMPPRDIPAVALKSLVPVPAPVIMLEPDSANGNVTEWELFCIAQLVANHKPAACFEIGTFDGRTALNMAANMAEDGHVYTLDLPPSGLDSTALKIAHGDESFIKKEASGTRFKDSAYAHKITQLWGDSATFDYAPYAGKMDLVFVDGSHSYDYVKKDTETALKLLKPEGGIILWHDYGSRYWKDLTRAMNELYVGQAIFKGMRNIRGGVLVVCEIGAIR